MFKENTKTVFVIGAGASEEVNLPIGKQLKKEIADRLNITFDWQTLKTGDAHIASALRAHTNNINPYLHAGRLIRDAMPQAISIDSFIDNHAGDEMIELCGKLAIVRSILEAERNSKLFFRWDQTQKPSFENIESTWYSRFWNLLNEGCGLSGVQERLKRVSFINFNYDRCLEHYLYHSFQNYYRISDVESKKLVEEIRIIHPYGSVGKLNWQNSNQVAFGSSDKWNHDLLNLSRQIKTFTQHIEDENLTDEMQKALQEADIIVFLGFAFHRQNMKLFAYHDALKAKEVYATAHGISDSGCNIILERIDELFKGRKKKPERYVSNKLKCLNLFDEYWLNLAL